MIESTELATSLSASGEHFIGELSSVLNTAKTTCNAEEWERIKRAIGIVIGTLEVEVLWPLYKKHPDLEPESLKRLDGDS